MIILIEIELLKRSSDSIGDLNIRKRFVSISKGAIYINDVIFEDINSTVIMKNLNFKKFNLFFLYVTDKEILFISN
jgi:hypothetical protein